MAKSPERTTRLRHQHSEPAGCWRKSFFNPRRSLPRGALLMLNLAGWLATAQEVIVADNAMFTCPRATLDAETAVLEAFCNSSCAPVLTLHCSFRDLQVLQGQAEGAERPERVTLSDIHSKAQLPAFANAVC